MEFKDFMSELVKKEIEVIGKDNVLPFLAKCGIQVNAEGKVISVLPGDKVDITQKLIAELLTASPLAKIPARVVIAAYKKFDPGFNPTL